MNWTGLARSLQPEIMGAVGALLMLLVAWLVIRSSARRRGAGVAQAQTWKLTNRGACALAIAIVVAMLWHVCLVAIANRLPRQDVDHSPVYERMDAIIKK